jgi:CMP-N,N'-diacetyllegionaminic acid synthase
MNILAIVPARGGSIGLPDKNILALDNHPLVSYSIAAGLQSPSIDRVICSTDSSKIAKIAKEYGAEVPFLRPAEYAQDFSNDIEAFLHAIEWLELNENYSPDLIVQLRPTSPIRFIEDIEEGINKMLDENKADSLRGVSVPMTSPYKMWEISKDKRLIPILKIDNVKEPYNMPRQKLPQVWAQNGVLEVIRKTTITIKKSMTGDNIIPLVINNDFYVDIDNKTSFDLAEELIKNTNCVKP